MVASCGETPKGTSGVRFDAQNGLGNPDPDAVTDIIFYATNSSHLGDIGGRAGVDTACADEVPAEYASRNIRAFISVGAGDGILDMPANYSISTSRPVKTPSGVELATNWADLVDGSIAVNLTTALENMPPGSYYWTGTLNNGAIGSTCDGWTNTVGGAEAGYSDAVDNGWLNLVGAACNASRKILCVAF